MTKQEKQEKQEHKTNTADKQRASDANVLPGENMASTAVKMLPTDDNEKEGTVQETEPEVATKGQKIAGPQLSAGPRTINRRQLLIAGLGAAATVGIMGRWLWSASLQRERPISAQIKLESRDQLVVFWNNATLQAIHNTRSSMPVAARALAIVHTCIYDAWAAYDATAVGTQSGRRLRRPEAEWTLANKCQAISFAAYRALVDLFPTNTSDLQQLMTSLNYNSDDHSTDLSTPTGLGNVAARGVLNFRRQDYSNQLGNLKPGAYADYTKYRAVNTSGELKDPNHWQPQSIARAKGQTGSTVQQFEGAQWANVIPFALNSSTNLIPNQGPARYPDPRYTEQAQEIIQYSAGLNDEQKVIAEYWSNGLNNQLPPGHWCLFAQFISQRDRHTLDQDVKLFFALTNAALDTSIACWSVKRSYDSPYPITAIRYLFNGKKIQAWGGPGKGGQWVNGSDWQPYRPVNSPLPSFPEYCAENSAFSAASAVILRNFTGSDRLNTSYTLPPHSSLIEPDNPITTITLNWPTFSHAAEQAGLAGLYSGVHFPQSDLDGRTLGQKVGQRVWLTAQSYINGSHK